MSVQQIAAPGRPGPRGSTKRPSPAATAALRRKTLEAGTHGACPLLDLRAEELHGPSGELARAAADGRRDGGAAPRPKRVDATHRAAGSAAMAARADAAGRDARRRWRNATAALKAGDARAASREREAAELLRPRTRKRLGRIDMDARPGELQRGRPRCCESLGDAANQGRALHARSLAHSNLTGATIERDAAAAKALALARQCGDLSARARR